MPLHVAVWSQIVLDSELSWEDQGKTVRLLANAWSIGRALRPAWASDSAWGAFERMWPEMEFVRQRAESTAATNSARAKAAAEARWDARSMEQACSEQCSEQGSPSPSPSPSRKKELPTEALPRKRGADTWLTPFGQAWEKAAGGPFQYKKAARDLGTLVKAHGPEKTLRAWSAYLAATPAEKASTSRFATTFGVWSGDVVRAPEPNDRRYSRAPDVGEQRQNIPTVEETRARLAAEDEERRRQELRAQARRAQGVA